MACVVRYSYLLISICLRSTSFANPELKVASLIGDGEKTIIIPCATDKTPQHGVYMYKKGANETTHIVFYYYKNTKSFTPKTQEYKKKVQLNGIFPNLTAEFSNVNTADTGVYWCEFNFEDKVTFGNVTMLLIDKETMKNSHNIMEKRDTREEQGNGVLPSKKEDKKCPEDPHVMIVLIVCVVLSLLCIIGFIFVILKVKGRWGNKEYSPKKPSDSVYEEMKRSNSDARTSGQIFLNPDYHSTKLLR